MIVTHQVENIKREVILTEPNGNLELEGTITAMKSLLEGHNRLELAVESANVEIKQ